MRPLHPRTAETAAALVVLCAFAVSCAGDGRATDGTGAQQSATIGAAGGSLSVDGATITIPPGALAEDTLVTLRSTSEEPTGSFVRYSPVYRFEPHGLSFAVSVEVAIAVAGPPAGVSVWWSVSDGPFVSMGGTREGDRVVALVGHFSAGFAGVPAGSPGADASDGRDAGAAGDVAGPFSGPIGSVPEDVARACTFVEACRVNVVGYGEYCVEHLSLSRTMPWALGGLEGQVVDQVVACTGQARACDQLLLCLRAGVDVCGSGFGRCDGDRAAECGDHGSRVYDCPALGLTCRDGHCAPEQEEPCDVNAEICDGRLRLKCQGVWVLDDVCVEGSECEQVGDAEIGGTSACVPVTRCDVESPPRCEGDTVVACRRADDGGPQSHWSLREYRWDCAAAGQVCGERGGENACVPAEQGTECERGEWGCVNGVDFRLCLYGHEVVLHCPDYGRPGCREGEVGCSEY